MTGDEYRAEVRRLSDIRDAASRVVSVYAAQVIRGVPATEQQQRDFEDAVGRIDETWPRIVSLLRQASDVRPTR
jgi:hypothetical protein